MRVIDLTMPLNHQWMADAALPTATQFMLAPRGDPEKGMTVGTESGTALLLPAQFAAFRRTRRLHQIPPSELVLRAAAVVDVAGPARAALGPQVLADAIKRADFRAGDALLVRTGWGDGPAHTPGDYAYLLDTPHLDLDGAQYLADVMGQRRSNLLIMDTALIGYPEKHLIPEWTTLTPRPLPWPSEAARAYLAGYLEREVIEDWGVDYRLAEAGIMTVKRVVSCGQIAAGRVRLIVAPLHVVRGIGATCRVVALEGDLS